MRLTPETKEFLIVCHESDGRASMRDIRFNTSLTENQRQHQFTKLGKEGYIEIERTPLLTDKETEMKIAVLTAKAHESINNGILRGEVYERKIRPDLVEMADTLEEVLSANDELAKQLADTQEYISTVLYPVLRTLRKDTIRHRKTLVGEFGPQVTALEVREDEMQEYIALAKSESPVSASAEDE
ncbi:hypothetical protein PM035_12890 [Halorubrum ezzemoulense]|uniref:hypothetical protein n=1 Tax=Halorubrum ezzemoulense TaxID=337243 RepID=UPI00232BE77B|nr:hypothetical protein [Halorubrum ezzemoulense]MDB2261822.1 hypothetical protein [Halorubrum ezzemoulense]MDB2268584.1 hypothetical protein [Halorubrum ezzemoulense]